MTKEFLEDFKNPDCQYGGQPFWAWNCKLDEEELLQQIDYLKEMGMGGFTMHCRTGLDTPYMGEEFLQMIKACVEKAKTNGMKAYLYDEDRWPSGAGGGEVTKDKRFRSRYLVFTPINQENAASNDPLFTSCSAANSNGEGTLLARYDIVLKDGFLDSYRRLAHNEEGDNVWYAYLEISVPSPWYNDQTYVDTLNKEAIEAFIKSTHEKYYEAVGDEFGKTIPSIFTDEPQFVHKSVLGFADEKKEIILPYTDGFDEGFIEAYEISLLDHLPELIWELPEEKISTIRYYYHDYLSELFAKSFADTLGDWCSEHNIKLTGHMMEEQNLHSQTRALGEAMRNYRGFHRPGIDILCDAREYSTAKQAQSVTHQMSRDGITSELYGVTNWDFDFRRHKLQGDWQAALGITNRVHHLSWVSMAGEAKRDYPASINYQSTWYKEYNELETYYARIGTILTKGTPHVKVGVIHPIESYWIHFGPAEQTDAIREQLTIQFQETIEWLLFGTIDFDFISESMLPSLSPDQNETNAFKVGDMNYDVIIVPGCETLRQTTVDRLNTFAQNGGKIVFIGNLPTLIDAKPAPLPETLSSNIIQVPFNRIQLLNTLKEEREIELLESTGAATSDYLYQMRDDGDSKYLFIANGKHLVNEDVPTCKNITINIKGIYSIKCLDTLTGDIIDCDAKYSKTHTILKRDFYDHDSLLLYLTPKEENTSSNTTKTPDAQAIYQCDLKMVDNYILSEPNVLILDQATFALDNEEMRTSEEVLRIDNILRTELGYPLKMEALAQPWTVTERPAPIHTLTLKYTFTSDIEVNHSQLAIENEEFTGSLNGTPISTQKVGWFVDKSIHTIELPPIQKGSNELILQIPYDRLTNLEWCYILGDFGVTLMGTESKVIEKPSKIGFGDWSCQGFPFYAGNITYQCKQNLTPGNYLIEVTKFRAPLVSISIDGERIGNLFTSPYRVNLGHLEGEHTIEITAYGSRVNTFGMLHNCNELTSWFGPQGWRSEGAEFSYEYQLKRCGVLASPKLFEIV